jgi:hypothetical protein
MNRRFLLSGIATAAASPLFVAKAQADQHESGHAHANVEGDFEACARVCSKCADVCSSCFAHCAMLLTDGKKEHASSLHSCNDCATVCRATAELCSRHSNMSHDLCAACEKVCKRCAIECEKFPNDQHMVECAKICRECAAACTKMIATTK